MIFPAELAASTQWGRAVCMERHGMPVRPIMATAACAVLVTQVVEHQLVDGWGPAEGDWDRFSKF